MLPLKRKIGKEKKRQMRKKETLVWYTIHNPMTARKIISKTLNGQKKYFMKVCGNSVQSEIWSQQHRFGIALCTNVLHSYYNLQRAYNTTHYYNRKPCWAWWIRSTRLFRRQNLRNYRLMQSLENKQPRPRTKKRIFSMGSEIIIKK